jgi:hypothetical protein
MNVTNCAPPGQSGKLQLARKIEHDRLEWGFVFSPFQLRDRTCWRLNGHPTGNRQNTQSLFEFRVPGPLSALHFLPIINGPRLWLGDPIHLRVVRI